MSLTVEIKSYNGIGDLLFGTPTYRRIKEKYPHSKIIVNTHYPDLLWNNPYIDEIGRAQSGLFLGYPDPIHCKEPTQHHIESDWEIIKNAYNLDIDRPDLKPEIYLDSEMKKTDRIGVQVIHKRQWYGKKVWPYFNELIQYSKESGSDIGNIQPIPKFNTIRHLIEYIATCRAVVCSEGAISHIAKAFNIPSIVVYGGFANPKWNGYSDQINITNKIYCSYCYNSMPCIARNNLECMTEISVREVFRALQGTQKIPELSNHNNMRFVEEHALRVLNGRGVDIGAGNYPLPGARAIQETKYENAYNIKEKNCSLDYIFSSHCLEHLEKPMLALSEWHRVLKIGGLLYLYLPHPDYIPWRKSSLPKWHKHNLYPDAVTLMLSDAGFNILYVQEKDPYFGHVHLARKR